MAPRKSAAAKAAAEIDADAHYEVQASGRFHFERASFGANMDTEILGDRLTRLLTSEHAPLVKSYKKKD